VSNGRGKMLRVPAKPRTAKTEVVKASSSFTPAVFEALVARFDAETKTIRDFKLDNDEDEAFSADRLIKVKAIAKRIEATRKDLTKPYRDATTKINALIKPYENKVAALLGAYAGLLGAYAIVKADRRLLAEQVAREAAADRDHDVAAEALNLAKDNEQSKLRGESGGSVSIAVGWALGGIDERELPAEYWTRLPDRERLELIAKNAGELQPPEIPGVVWVRATSQVVRGAK